MVIKAQEACSDSQELLQFLDEGVSPWHASAAIATRLAKAGFVRLDESQQWQLEAGKSYFVVRDQVPLIAFRLGEDFNNSVTGMRIAVAHLDSPGLRLKPKGVRAHNNIALLGAEIYGSPILATYADRDLSLAGYVIVKQESVEVKNTNNQNYIRLSSSDLSLIRVRLNRPIVKITSLAIHMDRAVNEKGLLLDKQDGIVPMMPLHNCTEPKDDFFVQLLADHLGISPELIKGWELGVYDVQPAALIGANGEWFSSARIDNLASCHSIMDALLAVDDGSKTCVAAFFDHEEVGSLSTRGAAGNFLSAILRRIGLAFTEDEATFMQRCSLSDLLSVDMAHAWHPAHNSVYDKEHLLFLNQGPAIKVNVNQRYATDATTAALFQTCCEACAVVPQFYSHKNTLPCGSTVGPIVSAALGIRSADVGNPMWGMHSLRETAGVADHFAMTKVLQAFFNQCGERS